MGILLRPHGQGNRVDDFLDRDGLIWLGYSPEIADKLLRRSGLTGHGGRPILDVEQLEDILGMLMWENDVALLRDNLRSKRQPHLKEEVPAA